MDYPFTPFIDYLGVSNFMWDLVNAVETIPLEEVLNEYYGKHIKTSTNGIKKDAENNKQQIEEV